MAAPSPDPSPDPTPDAERARRTTARLLGGCAALTVLVGIFQLGEIVQGADEYGAGAWLGVTVAVLAILGLVALYGACALGRATLRTRLIGKLDVFQVATVLLLVAVTAGVLIPTRNTTALALLLPWGITYWVHGLDATTSDEP
ncbi:hypothetical protein E1218_15885 [Kribbella turkmenica]|uniref:Uncharacterized protein n=1 Tax=Kribbella turkmenica TaxID=2530375 RepID=A0A4R4X3K7_9ACTN|nr:hypothetical protein [Kribbella turkmenica]TDD24822.1 hypothetical protein E1218_15885 [Kribbella turkmenica]